MANFRNPRHLSSFDSTKNYMSPYASYGVGPLGNTSVGNPFVDAPNKAYIDDFFQQALQVDSLIHPDTLLNDTLTHFGFDQPSFIAIPLSDINTTVQTLNLLDFLYAMHELVRISNEGGWLSPEQNQALRGILANTQGNVGTCINQISNALQNIGISSGSETQVQPTQAQPTQAQPARAPSATQINPIITYIKTDVLKYNLANRPTVSMNDRDVLEKVISHYGLDTNSIKALKLSKASKLVGNISGYEVAQGLLAVVNYGISSNQLDKNTANALIGKKYNMSDEKALATKTIGEMVVDLRALLGWTSGSRLGLGLGVGFMGLASALGYMKWRTGDFLGRKNPFDDEEADIEDEDVEDEDIDDESIDESFDDSYDDNEE